MPVYLLSEDHLAFPPPELASSEGVLAVGGDLSPERLLLAYQMGIFPWFNPGEPILWWSPDPRFVLFPSEIKISRSMRPYFNQRKFQVTFDRDFPGVIQACRTREDEAHRKGRRIGTWITKNMVRAYTHLHELGYAHSVEIWQEGEMVAGLYGIALGRVFFGESMFTRVSNASKFGFIVLVKTLEKQGFRLIDCQQQTRHLASLGARSIPRKDFLVILRENEAAPTLRGSWRDWTAEGLLG